MRKLIFSILFLSQVCHAQDFQYHAVLPEVDSSGFYKIQLLPEINSKLKPGFPDLRIYDNEKQEISYVLKDDQEINYTNSFREYPIVKKKILKDSITSIIIKNDSSHINNINLVVRNADVHKEMKVSGSFDGNQWFVVKEFEMINSINGSNGVSQNLLIDFPLTDYTLYKIVINDKHSAPVDVIKAGYFQSSSWHGNYTILNSTWNISDSLARKKTYLEINFPEAIQIDAIELKIEKPVYFYRKCTVYSLEKKPSQRKYFVADLNLQSDKPLHFTFDKVTASTLLFEINNDDNIPLKIAGINCFQLNHFCIARLEKDRKYELHFSDSTGNFPKYDLNFFQSIIPSNLQVIKPGSVIKVDKNQATEKETKILFKDKRIIWIVLTVVILLLGFVTFRMIKEMKP